MQYDIKLTSGTYTPRGGATLRKGDTIQGSEALVELLKGRSIAKPVGRKIDTTSLASVEPETVEIDELEMLRSDAYMLGIKVDKRWKEERLKEEIEKALEDGDTTDSE